MRTIQYGAAVASVYDAMFADSAATQATVDVLSAHIRGRDVVELGVGTGRLAIPLAASARSITGVDNSPQMLDVFRGKGVPDNVTLVEADFRDPLVDLLGRRYEVAYSTLGSMACCADRAELATALGNVADLLLPSATFYLEYYSRNVYLEVIRVTGGVIPAEIPGIDGAQTRLAFDPATDVMTARTTVPPAPEFQEDVLLLAPEEIDTMLRQAGFAEVRVVGGPGPFTWFLATTPSGDGPPAARGAEPMS